ncbi:MAG: AI-2E family transporter [Methanobrevibacter sp.]
MENNIISKLSTPLIIILILLVLSVMVLTPVLNMVILGIILSLGVRPVARKLNNKIKFKSISNILGMLLIIIPIILLLGYIIYVMISLSSSLISSQGSFSSFNVKSIASSIVYYLPPQYHSMSGTIATKIYTGVNGLTKIIFNYIIGLIKDLPNISVQLLVLMFTTFYFARDGDKVWDYVFAFIPNDRLDFFNRMFAQIKDVLKSIFYGHILTSIIIGLMGFVGYTLLGYPYSGFLGIMTGICQLIPVIGPWPIYCVLAIMDLFKGNYIRLVFVVLFGCVLSLSDMYIRPAISGRYADIHPLILLLGFVSGPLIMGIVGFILGPLILGVAFAVIKTYKEEKDKLIENKKENKNLS